LLYGAEISRYSCIFVEQKIIFVGNASKIASKKPNPIAKLSYCDEALQGSSIRIKLRSLEKLINSNNKLKSKLTIKGNMKFGGFLLKFLMVLRRN